MISASYTIQMASKISGVGVHTIRAWEKRYKALEPYRDTSGHRVYTKTDIEKLMLLSELCLLGYSISKVANLTIVDLKKLLIELGKREETLDTPDFNLVEEKSQVDVGQAISILLFALKNYNADVIAQELSKLKNVLSPKEFALDIIAPLASRLTSAHKSGEITLAQFDALRAMIKFHLGHLLYRNEIRENSPGKVLVCHLEGSFDLDMACVGLLCQHYHFNTTYAGELTFDALGELLKFSEAKILLLGTGNYQNENSIEKLLAKIKPETEVIIVGTMKPAASQIFSKKTTFASSLQQIDDLLSKRAH